MKSQWIVPYLIGLPFAATPLVCWCAYKASDDASLGAVVFIAGAVLATANLFAVIIARWDDLHD